MSCPCNRQTKDIHQLNTIIDPHGVQKFRYVMYAYLIKLGQKPNVDGDDEEAAEDSGSDLEIVICELNQKMYS
jgi:hypothetical protein